MNSNPMPGDSPSNSAAVIAAYLALLQQQREEALAALEPLPPQAIWHRPGPKVWSIGENLDHLRVIMRSSLTYMRWAWRFLRPWARRRRHHPFQTAIEDVYLRPGFPQNVGWLWPARHTPEKPVSFATLAENLRRMHAEVEQVMVAREPDLLGHVFIWDPVIGRPNLIQTLRIGIYHEALHYADITGRDVVRDAG